jgi:hypothetical protein
MSDIRIEVLRQWDAKALQTAELTPDGSYAVLLDFQVDPLPEEAGLPPLIAKALAQGLVGCGSVAGRWFNPIEAVPLEATLFPAKKKGLLQNVVERISNDAAVPVIMTESDYAVIKLLEQGWSMQQQALLLFPFDTELALEEALATLGMNRHWNSASLPSSAQALIAPGVDGDYILIAAVSEQALQKVLKYVGDAFQKSGIYFTE